MKNQFNINKEVGDIKNNYEDQTATPYISISDSSNMQVESSHFSINNKNSTSYVNNHQNSTNHNNNNNLILSNSGFLSLSKSINNNNINNSHNNNNNNSGEQKSFENVSLSGSNKLQISSNSIIFKKNDISKNSIFLSPSTLCNYYQQSNDVTPYKSPLMKQPEHEHELIHENEQSSGKEMHKLKQINIDILHKRKSTIGAGNNINKNINLNNININSNSNLNNINNNNCEMTSRSDECSLDNNKTLSSQRKYLFDKKTPIKYAKNQLKSGEKNKSSKSNNSKLENNNSNSNIFENKNNNYEEERNKKNKGISMAQNKNGRNLMDTFEKVGNDKENDDNLKFFNNRRQPTEIHLTSEDFKININNNIVNKNENNNNLNKHFIDRLDDDSSFMEKDININNKSINEIEEINFLEKIKNSLKEDKKEDKNIYNKNIYNNTNCINNFNFNLKNEKIEEKKDESNKENKENNIIKETKETNNINNNINIKKDDLKKTIKKILPNNKKENNNNITELSKNIIKELSRANSNKRKESRTKSRPTSFTKNIIINFNSFNSIGVNNNNNNNNIENIIGFKNKKNSNILIKKPKFNNEFRITNDILDKKTKIKNKQANNTIELLQIRRKIKIPNRPGKKEKQYKEISISNIANNNKEKKRPPSSENYNRRATSFSNLKQTNINNLFHNNSNNNNNNTNNNININNNNSNNYNTINNYNHNAICSNHRNICKRNTNCNSNYSGQKYMNKNQTKKSKPLIVNLFLEQDSKQTQKNINEHILFNHKQQNNINDLNNNIKNNQHENINHKIKKKIKPLINKKDKEKDISNTSNINANTNSIINNNTNDRNYQTVSSISRNVLDIKIRNKCNDKKDNDDLYKKKEYKFNKSLFNNESNNNNNNINININNNDNINDDKSNINMNINSNINNNLQMKKKEEQKVKIIQNFSSYHKIKYKSHIPEKKYFAEAPTKQFNLEGGDAPYDSNKNNNNLKKDKRKYSNNTFNNFQHGGENSENNFKYNFNYNNNYINDMKNNDNKIKHIKFRKLEKLPGDSDSGDVVLND